MRASRKASHSARQAATRMMMEQAERRASSHRAAKKARAAEHRSEFSRERGEV